MILRGKARHGEVSHIHVGHNQVSQVLCESQSFLLGDFCISSQKALEDSEIGSVDVSHIMRSAPDTSYMYVCITCL